MREARGKEILAIIPARGGSKGLPGKNIRLLAGRPLIAHTIELALESKYISKVVLSTENKKIAYIGRKYGAEVPFLRPKRLARNKSSAIDVILHAIKWFEKSGENFDIVCLLEPTSPLRKKNDIDDAIKLFIRNINKVDSLVSVGEVHLENPYIMKKIEEGYVKSFTKSDRDIYQRQQLPKAYFPYGVIYLSKIKTLKKYKTFYQRKTIPYFIKRWQNYEIDDIYDFICVEAILRQKLKKKS